MILKSVDYFVFSMSKEVENQGVVRSRRSKMDIQYNGQNKKDKQ